MKRAILAMFMIVASASAIACSEKEAFGFQFGKPVPGEASKTMREGGSVPNAVGFFDGDVPSPMTGFDRYGYGANRDRKFVHAVEAYRIFFDDRNIPEAERQAAYTAALEKIRVEILEIKKSWEELYGFAFVKDYDNGLSWTAETETVTAWIYVGFGFKLHVDCTNKGLKSKALSLAIRP